MDIQGKNNNIINNFNSDEEAQNDIEGQKVNNNIVNIL